MFVYTAHEIHSTVLLLRRRKPWRWMMKCLTLLVLAHTSLGHKDGQHVNANPFPVIERDMVIAGSMNLDTFIPVARLPSEGENLTLLPGCHPVVDVPGGKGCCQAVACSKLRNRGKGKVAFLGQIGTNSGGRADILVEALTSNNVDVSHCGRSSDHPPGHAYVFLQKDTGKVSAVISGGSNMYGWERWKDYYDAITLDPAHRSDQHNDIVRTHEHSLRTILPPTSTECLLLQREIPEFVNFILARHVQNQNRSLPPQHRTIVLQDIGGEDRPISRQMLSLCDYIVPNSTELQRLVHHLEPQFGNQHNDNEQQQQQQQQQQPITTSLPQTIQTTLTLAKILQKHGANNVLVTLGSSGSVLLRTDGTVLYRKSHTLPVGTNVVDETGAGDCYRAAFAVALAEAISSSHNGNTGDEGDDDTIHDVTVMKECMEFASAAGALAVTKEGAVPGVPSREEVDALVDQNRAVEQEEEEENGIYTIPTTTATSKTAVGVPNVERGGDQSDTNHVVSPDDASDSSSLPLSSPSPFPFLFGSRLNSMKDRPELYSSPSLLTGTNAVREWVKRQSTIHGLNCVDFNYPQHFHSWTAAEAREALKEAGLVAGAVCLRYPSEFARGAMNHPEEELRRKAVRITKEAADVARELGCNEVVVWSAYDGYDYPFQVDYDQKWKQLVQTFQECCDEYPDIKWSLEYKPTDENTRFFTVPSTGAAILLVKEINRPNMGLTLDVGHMLMAGENPGQSIAMVGGDKLFGIQLNDGYTRLAAEDGMMFGSIHPTMALEIMYQLRRIAFKGHLYFDTFPQRTDPVKEAEYNIQRVKKFWNAAGRMDGKGIAKVMKEHDALGALNICNSVLETQ